MLVLDTRGRIPYSPSPGKGILARSRNPSLISDGKTFGFLTFPAANGIAGTGLCQRFLSFGFSLIKVFDHLLEFRF